MRLQPKQLNSKSTLLTLFLFTYLSISCVSFADTITVPTCPKSISVKNGKVIDAEDWSYAFGRNFVDKNNNITMKDSTLLTDGKAPLIGIINSYNNKPSHYSAFDEEIETSSEIYYWRGTSLTDNNQYIFLCDALGSQDEHPVKSVYLYKKIPTGTKECKLTFYLNNGKRSWGNQNLECFN